jgi:hypothetical protein
MPSAAELLQDGGSESAIPYGGLALAPFFALVAAFVWWKTPELRVDVDRTHAVIHMELLGEYPSDIRSIEIERDGLAAPIWKVAAADGNLFQIHSISVHVGENPCRVQPFWGEARQIIPPSASTFRIDASRIYRVTICPASHFGLCRSAAFVLAPQ